MNEAITIIDPNAVVAPEAYSFSVDWIAFGVAAAAVVLTAVVAHRFLRRRLRASAVELASDALVRRLGLSRAARRGLRTLTLEADGSVVPAVLVLNQSMLVAAASKFRAGKPKKAQLSEVEELLKRLGVTPVRVSG